MVELCGSDWRNQGNYGYLANDSLCSNLASSLLFFRPKI